MAIDPKININENQVIFKGSGGHTHNGLTSSLIDYTKYSIFDFVTYPIAPAGTPRRNFEEANSNNLKSFIVNTIEQRVLNPQGIRIQANAISAREIISGTITAEQLASNIILVNNVIKSQNYNGTVDIDGDITAYGTTGWAITHSGASEFNDVFVRGGIAANTGTIGNILITSSTVQSSDYDGSNGFALYSNGFADFNEVSVRGEIVALSGYITDNFSIGSNVQIGGFANIGSNASIGTNLTIGTSATIGGSLKIGNNVRINDASEDGGLTTFKVKGETATAGKWIARFQKSTNAYVLTIENDGSVDVTGTLKVNGASVTTGGPYLPTSGGTVTGALTVNGNVIINDDVLIKSDSANTATTVMLASTNDQDERVLSTRANGYISAAYFPSGTGTTMVRSGGFIYYQTSTIKIKENIEYINESVLEFVKKLKPVKYTLKRTQSDTDYTYSLKQLNKEIGFIVEDIESVQLDIGASLIDYDSANVGKFDNRIDSPPFSSDEDFDDIEPRMYKTNAILSIAIKAIQELTSKNQELEARLQALEGV